MLLKLTLSAVQSDFNELLKHGNDYSPKLFQQKKIPHRNRSQVQVSLKVTAQIEHLNITVTLKFFLKFDIFSIDQSPEIAGKLNNYVLDYK